MSTWQLCDTHIKTVLIAFLIFTGFTGVSTADPVIHLKSGSFTPSENVSERRGFSLNGFGVQSNEAEYMLLQFREPTTSDVREEISSEYQVDFISYVPDQAWITKITGDKNEIVSEKKIRSLIPYKSDFRVDPELRDKSRSEKGEVDIRVQFFESVERPEEIVAEFGESRGRYSDRIWKVKTSLKNISSLAEQNHVQWISPEPPEYQTNNDDSRKLIWADTVQQSPYNLEGQGFTAGIWDGGEVGKHDDLNYTNKLFLGEESSVDDHATHVAGTMLGGGRLNNDYRGVAPNSSVISYDFSYSTSTELFNEFDESITSYDSILSQNSWGYLINSDNEDLMGDYAYSTYDFDQIIANKTADVSDTIPIIFSAGNEGSRTPRYNTTTGPGGTAKNTITVGAVDDTGDMTSFSSWGPTDDGRIKPTVVADGGCGDNSPIRSTEPGNNYGIKCGTSMSAPAVSGTVILFTQQFNKTYEKLPEPATVKASLIHTAKDLGREGPDYKFGWGLVNATRAINYVQESKDNDLIKRGLISDTGDSDSYSVKVPENENVKFTLVWSDPPGTSGIGKALINDLDLVVRNGDGERMYPYSLSWENRTNEALQSQEDRLNPVEQVEVKDTNTTDYTVEVEGYSLNDGSQDYSLVMTSKKKTPVPADLTVESPLNTSYQETPDFNLSSNQSLSKAYYSIDGGRNNSMDMKNDTFFYDTSVEVPQGKHEIVFYGENSFGNISSEKITFTVDQRPPEIDVKRPSNNSVVNDVFTVNATYSDRDSGIDYAIFGLENSSDVLFNSTGNFSLNSSEYMDGDYNITFTVKDSAGNTAKKFLNVTFDNSPPELNVLNPLNNSLVTTPFELEAYTEDKSGVVRREYEASNLSGRQISGSFNDTVETGDLVTGSYNFSFEAEDLAGNIVNKSVNVDVRGPVNLTVESPLNESYSENADFNLSSNVSLSEALFSVNGGQNSSMIEKNSTYFYNITSEVSEGSNEIVFWVRDINDYWLSIKRYFKVDKTSPTLDYSSLRDGENVSGVFDINASFSDASSIIDERFSIGGFSDSLNGTVNTSELDDGNYSVYLNATDSAGNKAVNEINITVDNENPSINVLSPLDNLNTSSDFEASAEASDTVSGVRNISYSLINGSYSINSTVDVSKLSDGEYRLIFNASDWAGNNVLKDKNFTLDTASPEVESSMPVNRSNISGDFDLEASWTDFTGIKYEESTLFNETYSSNSSSYDSTELADGVYNISFWAKDYVGNTENTSYEITVDNTAPVVENMSPEDEEIVKGLSWINASTEDTTSGIDEINFSITDKAVLVANYSGNKTVNWSSFDDGNYTANFSATDFAGNTVNKTSEFTVDNEKPEIKINDSNLEELENGWQGPGNISTECIDKGSGVASFNGSSSIKINESSKLVLNCTDNTGKSSSLLENFSIDSERPLIENITPENISDVEEKFEIHADIVENDSGVNISSGNFRSDDADLEASLSNNSLNINVSEASDEVVIDYTFSDISGREADDMFEYSAPSDSSGSDDGGSSGGDGGGGGGGGGGGFSGGFNLGDDEENETGEVNSSDNLEDSGNVTSGNFTDNSTEGRFVNSSGGSEGEVFTSSIDEKGEIDVSSSGTSISSVKVSGSGETSFTVEKVEEKEGPEESEVYETLDMDLKSSNSTETNVSFNVRNEWIKERQVDYHDVKLYRKRSEWEALDTEIEDIGDEKTFYTAEVPDFSRFSIAATRRTPAVSTESVQSDETTEEDSNKVKEDGGRLSIPDMIIITFFVISGTLGLYLVYSYYRKKRLKSSMNELREMIGTDRELISKINDAETSLEAGNYGEASKKIDEMTELAERKGLG